MQRRPLVTVLVLAAFSCVPCLAAAPPRPAQMTPAQFRAIQRLEAQPQHAAVLKVHATYQSERERNLEFTRASDDFWTVVYQGGFPAVLLTVLICAAPL